MGASAKQMVPFAPLERLITGDWGPRSCGGEHPGWTDHDLGAVLGVSRVTLRAYRRRGLSFDKCDQLATKVGLHPALVWPEWSDITELPEAPELRVVLSCPECGGELLAESEHYGNERRRSIDLWCPEHGSWQVTVTMEAA